MERKFFPLFSTEEIRSHFSFSDLLLCLLLLRTEIFDHLPNLPCQWPTSWELLFLAVGLILVLSSLGSWAQLLEPKLPHLRPCF